MSHEQSKDRATEAVDVGALIDTAVARRLGPAPEATPRWPALCDVFATATRLEVDFWGMGLPE